MLILYILGWYLTGLAGCSLWFLGEYLFEGETFISTERIEKSLGFAICGPFALVVMICLLMAVFIEEDFIPKRYRKLFPKDKVYFKFSKKNSNDL